MSNYEKINIKCSIVPKLEKRKPSPTTTEEKTEENQPSLVVHTKPLSSHSIPPLTPKMSTTTRQVPSRPPHPRHSVAPTRPPPPLGPPPPHVSARPPPPPLGPPPPHVSARPIPFSNINIKPQEINFKNKIFETLSNMVITPPSPSILPLPPKEWLCSK